MKREPVGNQHESDGWLRTLLRQTPTVAPDSCVDAETLSAWLDGGLSPKAARAVELHASNCSRCAAVLAAMGHSAPTVLTVHEWTLARVFRWVVPFAAAAAVVAIWIAVPEAPITEQRQAPQELQAPQEFPSSARADAPAAGAQGTMRDELQRERSSADAFGAPGPAAKTPAPAASAESAAVAPPAAPPPAASPSPSAAPVAPPADVTATRGYSLNADASIQRRFASDATGMAAESISPSNPLIHWRIAATGPVERSTDGGKTWTRVTAPPMSVVVVRAADADRAVVRSPDNAEAYTTDGGRSWIPVQENSAAPF